MAKLHTRQARKLRMQGLRGRNRKSKPKTFKTEEAAKKYAEAKGMKNYKLVDLQELNPKRNKIRVVV
jgi:phosphoribosylformimino-5-aminoimidazole carboxamide ribonucleotide (ProFAR) isomerase